MIGVSVFIFIGLCAEWSSAQFLNHRPYPTYSLEHMPDTEFSCRDKILGGYYADSETQCQMFHVCVKVSGVGVQDFRFLCPNGTAFDQDHQICADWQDVDCDATTLYYSSDNFDLYRIGSGFESKAVRYGEDEEQFSLQRAETGDVRLNREHQAQRVNQQKETYGYKPRPNEYQYQQNSNRNNNNNNNNNNKDDIFKGSSSSNFFNNRNGGKETDDDDYEPARVNTNTNQDNDQSQRRKQAGRKTTRRPTYEEQTEKSRPTGFVNNFAGSSFVPTTTVRPASTANNEPSTRQRQRGRVSPQYNNADNFRQTTNKNYEDDGRYRGETYNNGQYNRNTQTSQFTVSTPSPFKQNQENRTPQYNPSTASPQQTRSTENYPPSFNQDQSKYNEPQKTTNSRKENYPTSPVQTQPQTKSTDNYSSYRNNPQGQQHYNDQYETTKVKSYENYPTEFNTQTKKLTTPTKQADNYPTTYSPKSNKGGGYSEQYTTSNPQQNPTNTQTNTQDTTYNKPSSQYTPSTNYHHQQYDTSRTTNTQSTYNQAQTFKQTGQYNNAQQPQRQTTQYTQYTPTVPRITTPYYTSTTPASRRSNRFDETQYDDGSYNSKYDNDDDKSKDDEFLKTAHSINIASSRNEYNQNNKNIAVSTTQKPRPFSVTPNSFKPSEYLPTSNTPSTNVQNVSKVTTTANKPQQTNQKTGATTKKVKDVSYDYAYYDTNPPNDQDYDIGVDIEKSVKSKKQ
ncbi:hypothetical protein FQR65_LT09207 [Abscondita terminalis]|nr:hypothetical protein FQR65_LT09207 [Abscondita terminalis]